ncbi:PREDICTED: solute carrier family 7 member 13-like isoform X2 [Chinchilla lanigera]|uniref:solute carrier family 7 member 13-like isoform X2 n=1 Tax=Chinchilla lanigera TaxID=34839 RepID=UPI00038EEA53|nr:PREDICTED: solute carrier family 7 member 13-like isoform X2 [Chinchilla lanigera]
MQLSRAIGFFHGNIFLFSTTIGAGIFISPKGVLKSSSGNIPVSLSIWALCGILNIVNGLCAAETGATFPRSAAVYFLLKRTLGSCVAFLHVWIKLFGYFIGLAAQSLLVASSLIQPFYAGCSPPELPKKCLALAILWSLGLLNIRGVKTVSWFQTLSSLVKVAILCFISLAGIVLLVMGRKENVSRFESALDAELPDASQIAEAILQGFYPYVGSTVLVNIAGEVKNPSRTIPRSLISALSIVTVIYLLTNISYLTVLTPKEIISSDSVAATWVDRVLPSMQWVVSLGISASVIDTSSCGILSGSRLLYAVSQEGQLPLIFSMLNEHLSPAAAVIQLTLLTSIAVIPSNMTNLLKYVGLASWALTGLTMTALIKLRYQHPDLPRPYKAWLPMIFVSLVSSAFLIFMPIIQSPKMEHIYQVVFVLSGVLYYRLHVHLNQHSVFSEKITCYLQLLFNMSPSEDQQNCISTEKHGL